MKFLLLFALLVRISQQPLLCSGDPYFVYTSPDNMTYMSEVGLLAKPGCSDRCGEVMIPYPFGIRGTGNNDCYYNKSYEILCNASHNPPRPFLRVLNLEVMGIAFDQVYYYLYIYPILAVAVRMRPPKMCPRGFDSSLDLRGSPFSYLARGNSFKVQGCSGIIVRNKTGHVLAACTPTCDVGGLSGISSNFSCDNGIGCCQAQLASDVHFYNITVSGNNDAMAGSGSSHGCNTTVVFIDSNANFDYVKHEGTILRWKVPDTLLDSGDHPNFTCFLVEAFPVCRCRSPYYGNPYRPYGCRVDCSVYDWSHHCRRLHLLKLAGILVKEINRV